jgi:catechol 2,3-dioxygenase-like lactoylglutathione lyase family enzyme
VGVTVTRIVADLPVADVARANALYAGLFRLDIGMDQGWVGAVVSPTVPATQLILMTTDRTAPCNPALSIGVASPAEVDAVYERVAAAGLEIVHQPTDEDWGVHRFFFRDPDGNVVNVVAHTSA